MLLAVMPGNYAPETGFSDNLNHIAAFFVLSLLALPVYPGRYTMTVLWLVFYGILIEAIQIWIPGRSCSVLDLAADICGITAGIFLSALIHYFMKKSGKKIS